MIAAGTFVALPKFTCPKAPTNYAFCFPILTNSEGLIFASLVAFLLGLFLSTTFSRWWACREKLGVVMNNSAYLTMLLTNFVTMEEAPQQTARNIIRWMNLAHALIYKHANKDFDYEDIMKDQLITSEEMKKLDTYGNLPVMVLGWCMNGLRELISENKLGPVSAISPCINCVGACTMATQELLAFVNTQMPYAYLHLLGFMTKIHLIFIIFYGGGIIASGIHDEIWTRIIFGYTVIIANNIIYEGLLHIHSMLGNPIGNDTGDFPKHVYMANTRAICTNLQSL